ncbi:MAG TPA: ChaN family lipoprotein [Candidatus Sulfotelmatobacter sp.]|nr:ChaN family lipoprotein [Candidatus Sulfotelmatobacter sp.]
MASTANLRSRRSAAQLHALAEVEREIRSQDSNGRRKYLREFNRAFRNYEAVLAGADVQSFLRAADVVLIGDYHALGASQRCAASLLEQRALAGDRPVVLGVETIFARDQHILDEWWRRDIDESELRQRIRFDLDWGYDWAPFYELLVSARDNAEALYGLDCMPREDLRKIGARDRHAALKVAEIRQRHPNAAVFVLFGESHMAPSHLPRAVRRENPDAKVVTVLQNVDSLYWRAAGEQSDKVEAVRVNDDVICIFNATPLEKYESYRLFLDQWSRCGECPDYAPTIYNLIDSLASFLQINRYSPHNTTQPKFLVDLLPEVYGGSAGEMFGRLLLRKNVGQPDLKQLVARIDECGSAYLPEVNAFYVREFQMVHAAEDATRFLHQACQGLPQRLDGQKAFGSPSAEDRFYARVIEHAVAYFGSRILYPSRLTPTSENVLLTRAAITKLAQLAIRSENGGCESAAQEFGQRLGSQIYEAYLAGKISPSGLRRLFLAHLHEPGIARKVCVAVISKLRAISQLSAKAAQA